MKIMNKNLVKFIKSFGTHCKLDTETLTYSDKELSVSAKDGIVFSVKCSDKDICNAGKKFDEPFHNAVLVAVTDKEVKVFNDEEYAAYLKETKKQIPQGAAASQTTTGTREMF